MESAEKKAKNYLMQSQNSDCGWGYEVGKLSSLEPTIYAALALGFKDRAFDEITRRALVWLAARQKPNGALALPGQAEDHWTTLLYLQALVRLGAAPDVFDKVARWTLEYRSSQAENSEVNQDGKLIGWGWTWSAFSWVEPTAHALLALKLAGYANHPRIKEATRLLFDRACADGGWNYGNREVMGQKLTSFIPTTALALLALQDDPTASEYISEGLDYLQQNIRSNLSTLNLALTILCFDALDQPTTGMRELLLSRQSDEGDWRGNIHLTALAALALATTGPTSSADGGKNVFRL